ncbi:AfsR/SARP family transcriptional regulator [Streptomyces sp. NPDC005202]|uniref:AfsR/SARP family transcriptional regulator n=1 Tax=Streptomyces sp. NPDC005202 TaxID=3157021 RepID=UPI0033B546F4
MAPRSPTYAPGRCSGPRRARLDEVRRGALENRVGAYLMLGRHAELIGDLSAMTARYPLQESLHALLIVSLHRSGEALEAFRRLRASLVNELGIEPSHRLQRLHHAILHDDPALDSPASGLAVFQRPGTAEAGVPVYRLQLEKRRRAGHRGRFETRNLTDSGADSSGRIITPSATRTWRTSSPTRSAPAGRRRTARSGCAGRSGGSRSCALRTPKRSPS